VPTLYLYLISNPVIDRFKIALFVQRMKVIIFGNRLEILLLQIISLSFYL